jgi:hypothetical protein
MDSCAPVDVVADGWIDLIGDVVVVAGVADDDDDVALEAMFVDLYHCHRRPPAWGFNTDSVAPMVQWKF